MPLLPATRSPRDRPLPNCMCGLKGQCAVCIIATDMAVHGLPQFTIQQLQHCKRAVNSVMRSYRSSGGH
jgi:hypothetical protein